jgi:hypothetical protein
MSSISAFIDTRVKHSSSGMGAVARAEQPVRLAAGNMPTERLCNGALAGPRRVTRR